MSLRVWWLVAIFAATVGASIVVDEWSDPAAAAGKAAQAAEPSAPVAARAGAVAGS